MEPEQPLSFMAALPSFFAWRAKVFGLQIFQLFVGKVHTNSFDN